MPGNPEDDRRGPAAADGAEVACLFLCPNPTCDTELVVLPEQAGQAVECPTCGFRFVAPDPVPPEVAIQAMAARPNVEEAKAAQALDAMASPPQPRKPPRPAIMVGGHQQYPAPRPAPQKPSAQRGKDRRRSARVGVGERLLATTLRRAARRKKSSPETPAAGGPGPAGSANRPASKAAQLALTWIAALAVSAALAGAAFVGRMPELALGAAVFIGLAILRTVMVARRRS